MNATTDPNGHCTNVNQEGPDVSQDNVLVAMPLPASRRGNNAKREERSNEATDAHATNGKQCNTAKCSYLLDASPDCLSKSGGGDE